MTPPPAPRLFTFAGGSSGTWRVEQTRPVVGESLPATAALSVVPGEVGAAGTGDAASGVDVVWRLRGIVSNERYVERAEKDALVAKQEGLGRPACTRAALIPIRKNAAWWALTQDERRAIFEQRSHHIADSLAYLPRIARRLYHARDLGQPFDFLTWFEFAPEHAGAFDELVAMLRSREEWTFVDREVEVRLSR